MNSFGRLFRISIFGESHGQTVGIIIDGCPAGIEIKPDDFTADIERRKSGAAGTTPRKEEDIPEIISGVFNDKSTGAPITILFRNNNTRSADYDAIRVTPRPGHADFVLHKKFDGFNDYRGGGHSSGRLTLCLVAAGVIAKKVLNGIDINASLIEAGGDTNIDAAIATAVEKQDSIGGIVECSIKGLPVGLGEPFFDSVESAIAHIAFSIPAIKGIEFGSGFAATKMTGSENNDAILDEKGTTKTNHAGGINGGITNGNPLVFRLAVKPASSTPQEQQTYNTQTQKVEAFTVKGRHDLCIALRVPVVAEAAAATALADLYLIHSK
ncbi:MAG: chorismate synthase [Bacteroidetes bacterium]|nr:chorismate synthase [Bacteroidota bacterium]